MRAEGVRRKGGQQRCLNKIASDQDRRADAKGSAPQRSRNHQNKADA